MNVILITEAHSVFMAFDDASTRNCHDQIIEIRAAAFMIQVGTIVLSTNPKSLNSL